MKKPKTDTRRKGSGVNAEAKVGRSGKKGPRTNKGNSMHSRQTDWQRKFFQLLRKYNACPITTDAQHREALANIDSLMKPHPDRAESYAIELMSRYIVEYESQTHPTPDVPPGRMLAHLIEAREVTQAEVAESTGIPASTISAVIAGRRNLSTDAIGRLCDYFNISSDVFIQRHVVAT